MTKDFAIRICNTAPVVRTRSGASGIEMTLRFLAHPRRRSRLMARINRRIMEAVDRADNIDFAYDTVRVLTTSADSSRKINRGQSSLGENESM